MTMSWSPAHLLVWANSRSNALLGDEANLTDANLTGANLTGQPDWSDAVRCHWVEHHPPRRHQQRHRRWYLRQQTSADFVMAG
jgi:hypothetical protein